MCRLKSVDEDGGGARLEGARVANRDEGEMGRKEGERMSCYGEVRGGGRWGGPTVAGEEGREGSEQRGGRGRRGSARLSWRTRGWIGKSMQGPVPLSFMALSWKAGRGGARSGSEASGGRSSNRIRLARLVVVSSVLAASNAFCCRCLASCMTSAAGGRAREEKFPPS